MTRYLIRTLGAVILVSLGVGSSPALAVTVSMPANAGAPPGLTTTVAVDISSANGVLGTDIVITFDPAVVTAQAVAKTSLSSPHTLTSNLSTPGVLRISLFGATPLSGSGALLNITFRSEGPAGANDPLHFQSVLLNEGQIPVTPLDGHYCVRGRPNEVQNLEIGLPAPGSTEVGLSWGAVSFAIGYNVYRGGNTNLADLACTMPSVGGTTVQDDGTVPAPGNLLVYLVTSINCSDESTLGFSSTGVERIASAPCN